MSPGAPASDPHRSKASDGPAVVSKDARVVGEVGIREDAAQRTETVPDKVRHTEVDDGRGAVTRTGTTDTTTTPRKPL